MCAFSGDLGVEEEERVLDDPVAEEVEDIGGKEELRSRQCDVNVCSMGL
jgi:hypothetical protein